MGASSGVKRCCFPRSSVLAEVDLVLDCTGSDVALEALAQAVFPVPRIFSSVSVGFRARRTFVFVARADRFPREAFLEAVRPWLRQEAHEAEGRSEVAEGAGCWSPLFPARLDDLWIAAAGAVKVLEEKVLSPSAAELIVLEQQPGASFAGLRRVPGTEVPCG